MDTLISIWVIIGLLVGCIYVINSSDHRLRLKNRKHAPLIVLSIIVVITITWPIPVISATVKYFTSKSER